MVTILGAFAGFFSGQAALFVLHTQRVAFAGQLRDLRLGLRQAFACAAEFGAQWTGVAAAGGGELAQLVDHADEDVFGDVSQRRCVGSLEFLAQTRDLLGEFLV